MSSSWLHRSCDFLARSVFLHGRFCTQFSSPPPSPLPLGFVGFSPLTFSVWWVPVLLISCGGSWLGCAVVPVMGALLQPRCWLPIVEAPGYSRHPTPILAMQLLTCNIIFYMKFNRPFCLFSFHKDQKYIDTAGKTTLKLGNLKSLKVICPKQAKILLHKVAKFFRHW